MNAVHRFGVQKVGRGVLTAPRAYKNDPPTQTSRAYRNQGWLLISMAMLFLFSPTPSAAEITIWTESKPALVFAGENRTVRLFLKNSGPTARKINFDVRTFQVAATATTPLGERKRWKEIALDPGQTSVEKFPLALPTARAATTLILKFYEQNNVVELASLPLLVYPEDLLAQLSEKNKLASK